MSLETGDKAPHFQVEDVNGELRSPSAADNKATLLCFFRHAGCPPCNLRMHELMLAEQKIADHGIGVLAVFESTPEHIRRDLAHGDVPFPILPDRERRLYELYSVRPSLGGFISSFLLRPQYSMKAIFKHGYIPRFPEATTMMPAEFLIAPNGTVKLAYYGKDIGDYLPLDEILSVVTNLNSSAA